MDSERFNDCFEGLTWLFTIRGISRIEFWDYICSQINHKRECYMTWPSWSLYAKLSLLDRDIGPDIFDESKPHECPYRLNPKTCTCSSCTQTKKVAYSKQLLAEEEAVNFGFSKNIQRDGATFGSMRAPEPQPAPRETTKEKYERQRKERYDQLEKTTAYLKAEYSTLKATKKTISVTSPSIEEMLDNPELDGISSVNIDPVSMAVETAVDLIYGAKDFVSNPSLGGVAAMAVTAIPGKIADKIVSRVPGKILGEYDSLNVGPLPDGVAETFSGGKYVHIETNEPIKLYRAYHPGAAKEFGGFWSLDMPKGSLQTQIDSALLPEWGNKASKYTVIEIPSGGKLKVGEVGYQKGLWSGGGTQVLVDGGVKESWKVGEGLLK